MSSTKTPSVSYVYALLDPRRPGTFKYVTSSGDTFLFKYEPFYVGKGTGSRAYAHLVESRRKYKKDANTHKLNRITKITESGHELIVKKVRRNLIADEAYDLECALISAIGRRDLRTGPLTNWSAGGEGVAELSERTRKRHSIAQSSYIKSKTFAEHLYFSLTVSDSLRERWANLSEREKQKHRDKTLAHWNSLDDAGKAKIMRGFRKGYRNWISSLSPEQLKSALGSGSKNWWRSMDAETRKEHIRKTSAALKKSIASRTNERREEVGSNIRQAQLRRIASLSPEQKAVEAEHKRMKLKEYRESVSGEEWKARSAKARLGQLKKARQCPWCEVCHVNSKLMITKHFDNCAHAWTFAGGPPPHPYYGDGVSTPI